MDAKLYTAFTCENSYMSCTSLWIQVWPCGGAYSYEARLSHWWYGIHNFHEYDFPMINKYDIGVNDMEENDLNDAHSELSLEII